jgi:hypothetical protein
LQIHAYFLKPIEQPLMSEDAISAFAIVQLTLLSAKQFRPVSDGDISVATASNHLPPIAKGTLGATEAQGANVRP